MGWSWAGAAEWLSEKKERDFEREKWEEARKDKMISLILPELIERRKAREGAVKESKQRIATAVSYKMDMEAAAILEANGQLPSLLSKLEKVQESTGKDIDRNALKVLSETLLEKVSPEQLASAMKYAIDDDFLQAPSSEKLLQTLYATKSGDLLTVAAELGAGGTRSARPNIGTFDINQMALIAVGQEERKKVQETIEKAIAPQIGGTVGTNAAGQQVVQFEDPTSAARIVQNAVDYFFAQTRDPMVSRSEVDVMGEIYDKTLEYTAAGDPKDSKFLLARVAATPFGQPLVEVPRPEEPAGGTPGSTAEEYFNTENLGQ